ncbi:MAG TPA: type II and III secretion system protein [Terriglobales bacterium]|nr:type II and III secretion system protein [Terriglobales bacterium]
MWWQGGMVCLALAAIGRADTPAETKPAVLCTIEANNCEAPAKDLRRASAAYWHGVKRREKDLAGAYQEFTEAARLVPGNLDYANARELARIALAHEHIESGNHLLAGGRQVEAVAEFRAALDLDAANAFAQQRLMDALGDDAPRLSPGLRLVERSDPVELLPQPGLRDLHYRGDARGLYEMIARSFGIRASFDQSFTSRPVRFDVERVDFAKAMELASMVSKSFWVPLSETEFVVAADTAENHRELDRMSLRSFYVTQASSPQDLNDVAGMLRGVFDIRLVTVSASKNLVTVRAPRQALDAATEFLNQLSQAGPQQVLLEIQAFEIDRMVLRNLGLQLPLEYNIINLSQAAALLASQPNIQQLINQLIAFGGINQANSTALQALLAQLQQQQLNPLLTTPFATFGGGITLTGVTIPKGTANFQFNSSNVKTLQHMTLRAMQGKAASLMIGTRYPILNATFAPIFNSPAIAQSIQTNTFQAAFPSFSYEDLGLKVKATPSVHGEADVTLDLETDIRALTGQAFNGVPVISTRSYKSTITVKDGETAVVVGYINRSEQNSLGGLPGLGAIPGFGELVANQNKTAEDDEFLLVITPHILQLPPAESQAVWLPAGR